VPYDSFDRSTREQIVAFIKSFLSCKCQENPFCGCPERKFVKEIIELRESGLDHIQISQYLRDEFGIEIYPADILSYLEESVHLLEAIQDIADQFHVPRMQELGTPYQSDRKGNSSHIRILNLFFFGLHTQFFVFELQTPA
jgi:superfamily II helicase